MDRESFYAGLGMLFVPLLFYLIYLLVQLQINWSLVGIGLLGLAYFGTAIFLLIKGALLDN